MSYHRLWGRSGADGARRGAIAAWVIIAIPVIVGMAALSVDVSRLIVAKQQLQNAADAAALAAVGIYRSDPETAPATQEAARIAAANTALGSPVLLDTATDVRIGAWDAARRTVVPWSPTYDTLGVTVLARRTADSPGGPVPTYFASLFGLRAADVSARGTAIVRRVVHERPPVEMMVIQDASGSFREEWADAIRGDRALVEMISESSREGDRTGFVAFSDAIKTTYLPYNGATRPLTLALTDYVVGGPVPAQVVDKYAMFAWDRPAGYTNPGAAFAWALDEFATRGDSASQQVIVLVSDGMPFGPTAAITARRRADAIAQADAAAARGIKIHTVTLTAETSGTYGTGGADFEFNASLVRNGGYAFRTHDASKLRDLMLAVGNIELGAPCLAE